jgi:carboxymuconolactone decarboxylase family protein
MDLFGKTIDPETQLLVAIGAAVAAGCEPCLTRMVGMANQADVEEGKLKTAAIIGQFVKDQTATDMKKLADGLLATHLNDNAVASGCFAEKVVPSAETQFQGAKDEPTGECGCGCG